MARTNKTQFAILGQLSKQEYLSGYDIKRLLEKSARFYWSESNAQLYPLLKKLLDEAMVTVKTEMHQGRLRKLYRITDKGKDHLLQWLRSETENANMRSELLLKLSFGQNLSDAELLEHINLFEEQIRYNKRKVKAIQQHISSDHKGRQDQRYLLLSYRMIELITEAQEQWCREAEEGLKQ